MGDKGDGHVLFWSLLHRPPVRASMRWPNIMCGKPSPRRSMPVGTRSVKPVHLPGFGPHPRLPGRRGPDRTGGGEPFRCVDDRGRSAGRHGPRLLVKAHAGDLDVARDLAQRAVARPRLRGSTYWRAPVPGRGSIRRASARNWPTALEALREPPPRPVRRRGYVGAGPRDITRFVGPRRRHDRLNS